YANTNTISGNMIAGNYWTGLALDNSNNNLINIGNIFSANQIGVYVVNNSNGNSISKNNLQNNTGVGLFLDYAMNTKIYNNNFINSTIQALAQNGTGNTFYRYNSGGNYWSDWSSMEKRSIVGNEGLYDQNPSLSPF
ncbi:MAG: right-handed parallel beta-helix repeat-containing protein, partial [Methanobacterium sp.]|nr:right-handed parallel beta-helix repeat-containing protein [Methanobacterium sp.]